MPDRCGLLLFSPAFLKLCAACGTGIIENWSRRSYHHSLGSRCSNGLSWSFLQRDPSCWGKARWRSVRRICGCRYCWIDGGTHAYGSKKKWERTQRVTHWQDSFCLLIRQQSSLTHHFVVLYKHHVVCAERSAKDDASHTLETVDPLLSLWPLATHIKHPVSRRKSEKSQ